MKITPNDRYITNSAKALEAVIPTKITLEDIGINLGERWIPESYYSGFATLIFTVQQ
ncbi:MAG: hypothetical protein LBP72_07505 [Dysgonamonadaceae bacterium]|jgi:N12 class adenine-specific DNA methylase|nr:hypothetical protein [Dysgonamonadaceae bacterium]